MRYYMFCDMHVPNQAFFVDVFELLNAVRVYQVLPKGNNNVKLFLLLSF